MKILIIATPRTGSTYFSNTISKNYNLKHFFEPKLDTSFDDIICNDNIVVKIMTGDIYRYYQMETKLSIEDSTNLLCERLSKYKFDNIILLHRKNKKEHIEALINLKRVWGRGDEPVNTEWVIDNEFKKYATKEQISIYTSHIDKSFQVLDAISKNLQLPIIHYEDLYYNTESVDLQGLEFKPDLSKKLRKEIKINNII